MLSVIKVSIELTTNGKKRFKLKTMNNEYYEFIEGEEGMFCFGKISKMFWCNARSSPHITGCIFDWWEDLMEYMVRVTGNS